MIRSTVAVVLLSLWSIASQAATLTWTLENAAFVEGGGAVGSFDYDATTDAFSNININTFGSIETSYTVLFNSTPDVVHLTGFDSISMSQTDLLLFLSSPMTNAGGTIRLDLLVEITIPPSSNRTSIEAYITAPAVPIPAAFWLFASGIVGLFGVSRRIK